MENEGFKFKYYFDSADEEKEYDASSVSYTHLDVYKRQI